MQENFEQKNFFGIVMRLQRCIYNLVKYRSKTELFENLLVWRT